MPAVLRHSSLTGTPALVDRDGAIVPVIVSHRAPWWRGMRHARDHAGTVEVSLVVVPPAHRWRRVLHEVEGATLVALAVGAAGALYVLWRLWEMTALALAGALGGF